MLNNLKIYILTIQSDDNYGNKLQNYATMKILCDLGLDPKNIVISRGWYNDKIKPIIRRCISILPMKDNHIRMRLNNFRSFHKRNIKDLYIRQDKIKNLDEPNSIFLVGSDQVWNPNLPLWNNKDLCLLGFVKKGKKASIAASIGIEELTDEEICVFKENLPSFDAISVREDFARVLLKETAGINAQVLIDPTLCITGNVWREIKSVKRKAKKNYLLKYFLGNADNRTEKIMDYIAQNNNLEIIEIGNPKNKSTYSYGPRDFISLVDDASIICTDSFHGTAFSINLHKPFIVFNRLGVYENMGSRIDSILKLTKFENRKISNVKIDDVFKVSFYDSENILENKRKEFYAFLKCLLGTMQH